MSTELPDWVVRQRLWRQHLVDNPCATPHEVVAGLGAVQAQEYAGAKWSLGLRLSGAGPGGVTDAALDGAFNEGLILRTHVLRPTWHFVAPADIRWLLALTGPHVHRINGTMYRRLELDDALLRRGQEVLRGALHEGRSLTREELGAALAQAGIAATGQRLAYIVMAAELDGVICSGPRRGKQFTYMLLDERAPVAGAPQARGMDRDEALAELTRRYFRGHGPATERDYAWWSGLTLSDVRRGIGMVRQDLAQEVVDGTAYWFTPSEAPPKTSDCAALLLPTYDEFLMGFAGASRAGGVDPQTLAFDSTIVVDGRIVGTWRREVEKGTVILEVVPLAPFSASDARLPAAGERFAAFLQLPVEVRAVQTIG